MLRKLKTSCSMEVNKSDIAKKSPSLNQQQQCDPRKLKLETKELRAEPEEIHGIVIDLEQCLASQQKQLQEDRQKILKYERALTLTKSKIAKEAEAVRQLLSDKGKLSGEKSNFFFSNASGDAIALASEIMNVKIKKVYKVDSKGIVGFLVFFEISCTNLMMREMGCICFILSKVQYMQLCFVYVVTCNWSISNTSVRSDT